MARWVSLKLGMSGSLAALKSIAKAVEKSNREYDEGKASFQ
jgi:hypothetical protein